jgi:hypothetical protein
MYPTHPEVQSPLFCFSATTHQTGKFLITEDVKAAMGWTRDCNLGFVIFDAAGKTRYQGVHPTSSGGEVNPDREFTAYEKINVVVFWPKA